MYSVLKAFVRDGVEMERNNSNNNPMKGNPDFVTRNLNNNKQRQNQKNMTQKRNTKSPTAEKISNERLARAAELRKTDIPTTELPDRAVNTATKTRDQEAENKLEKSEKNTKDAVKKYLQDTKNITNVDVVTTRPVTEHTQFVNDVVWIVHVGKIIKTHGNTSALHNYKKKFGGYVFVHGPNSEIITLTPEHATAIEANSLQNFEPDGTLDFKYLINVPADAFHMVKAEGIKFGNSLKTLEISGPLSDIGRVTFSTCGSVSVLNNGLKNVEFGPIISNFDSITFVKNVLFTENDSKTREKKSVDKTGSNDHPFYERPVITNIRKDVYEAICNESVYFQKRMVEVNPSERDKRGNINAMHFLYYLVNVHSEYIHGDVLYKYNADEDSMSGYCILKETPDLVVLPSGIHTVIFETETEYIEKFEASCTRMEQLVDFFSCSKNRTDIGKINTRYHVSRKFQLLIDLATAKFTRIDLRPFYYGVSKKRDIGMSPIESGQERIIALGQHIPSIPDELTANCADRMWNFYAEMTTSPQTNIDRDTMLINGYNFICIMYILDADTRWNFSNTVCRLTTAYETGNIGRLSKILYDEFTGRIRRINEKIMNFKWGNSRQNKRSLPSSEDVDSKKQRVRANFEYILRI